MVYFNVKHLVHDHPDIFSCPCLTYQYCMFPPGCANINKHVVSPEVFIGIKNNPEYAENQLNIS